MKSNEISDYQKRRCKGCGIQRVDHFPTRRCPKFLTKAPPDRVELEKRINTTREFLKEYLKSNDLALAVVAEFAIKRLDGKKT
jgi:hypothetical protein